MTDLFKTPELGHLSASDFEAVYEPAEDSFLLLDMLEQDHAFLKARDPAVCLEVGCGSGICITFLSQILDSKGVFFCTDINPKAAKIARATGLANGRSVEPVVCNLTDGVEERLRGCVDVLLFNPPYVVTPSYEVASSGIEASWAGGTKGREVTDKFLPRVDTLLSPDGVFYLIVIKENDPEDIERVMEQHGFVTKCLATRRAGRELLSVLRFTRKDHEVAT